MFPGWFWCWVFADGVFSQKLEPKDRLSTPLPLLLSVTGLLSRPPAHVINLTRRPYRCAAPATACSGRNRSPIFSFGLSKTCLFSSCLAGSLLCCSRDETLLCCDAKTLLSKRWRLSPPITKILTKFAAKLKIQVPAPRRRQNADTDKKNHFPSTPRTGLHSPS